MSTEFNFPADPTVGDIVTLPNGSDAKWNGTEWALIANEVVYPITIDKGGTSAIDVATALLNLEIPRHNTIDVATNGEVTISCDTEQLTLTSTSVDPVAGNAILSFQKGTETSTNGIWGYSGKVQGSPRWFMHFGDGAVEAGLNSGTNFTMNRYNDAGEYLGKPLEITRADGTLSLESALVMISSKAVDVAGDWMSFQLRSKRNSALELFGEGTAETPGGNLIAAYSYNNSRRWNMWICDGTPETGGNTGSNFNIQAMDDSGNFLRSPLIIARTNGEATFSSDIFAPKFWGTSSNGIFIQNYSTDGTTFSLQVVSNGNPGWQPVEFRTRYNINQVAGFEMVQAVNGQKIFFVHSNAGAWGSVRAASFDVQSDVNTKQSVSNVSDALGIIDGIQAHTYEFTPTKDQDAASILNNRRRAGTMSQDWLTRLPEAVTDSGGGNLMLDYSAISAITVQAVSELLQRVKSLEAQLAALDL